MNEFLVWLTGLVAIVIPGFGATPAVTYNGYVEADYVYAAPVTGGPIETLAVREGDLVRVGDLLFTLRQSQQVSLVKAAEANIIAAEANAANLATGGRDEEVAVTRASLQKATADLNYAQTTLERSEKLAAEGIIPTARLEQDRATVESASAQVTQLVAQLRVAELPARDPLQAAAEANLLAARADAERVRSDLADRTILSPVDARVERLYFAEGELAAAGTPVVALLPAAALKVKFYVPEADRQGLALGGTLAVSCDGCDDGLTATLSYVAADPQFTPPVIYSRDERHRLSFLAEATLDPNSALHPGQPVSIGRPQ